MFKKNRIAIISNDKRRKKQWLIILSIIIMICIISLVLTGGLFRLMDNSVVEKREYLEYVISGDFNLDGLVNWDDYYLLSEYNTALLKGQDVSNYSEDQLRAGDINYDGIVYFTDQYNLNSFLNNQSTAYEKTIGVKTCGYYYNSEAKMDFSGQIIFSGCVLKDSNNYKYNDRLQETYRINYYDIYTDLYNDNSFVKGYSASDGITINEINYNKYIKLENDKRAEHSSDNDSNYYKFNYSIVKSGLTVRSDMTLCYIDSNQKLVGYTSEDDCKKNGYVKFKTNENVARLIEPGNNIIVENILDLNKYRIAYNNYYFPITHDDNDMLNIEYIKKGEKFKVKDNTVESFWESFAGWYLVNEDNMYYCYTAPNNTNKNWTNEETCEHFGYVLYQPGDIVVDIIDLGKRVYFYQLWKEDWNYIYFNGNTNTSSKHMDAQLIKISENKKLNSNIFEKEGYAFAGWYAKKINDDIWYCYNDPGKGNIKWSDENTCKTFGYVLIKDEQVISQLTIFYDKSGVALELYAQWEPSKFTLKFDANGGTKSMHDQKIVYGTPTAINENIFERPGYKFIGWHAKRDDGKWYCYTNSAKTKKAWSSEASCRRFDYYLYKDGLMVKDTANPGGYTTMYAQWTNKYTLKFDGNGGTGIMPNQEFTYGTSKAINKNTFERPGYKFIGWYAKRDDGKGYCYAQGSTKASWVDQGHCDSFGKYYLYKDGLMVKDTANPGGYTTMYAQWTNKYTLKFAGNGGTKSMRDQELTYGKATAINKNTFERTGYKFIGWRAKRDDGKWYCYTNSSKTKKAWSSESVCNKYDYYLYKDGLMVKDTANPGGYTTMYAQWTNKYTLKFDGNGGTGIMPNQEFTYGTSKAINKNTFERLGYKFIGWYAKRDDGKGYCYAQGASKASWVDQGHCDSFGKYYLYKDGLKVKDTANPGGYTKMVAQWEKLVCTIKYSCDRGTLLGDGPDSYCLIDYGKATKYLVRTYCPSGMQKLDETKCSYKTYTYIPGTKIYECPKGGKASGNTCYLDTKKEYGYKCTNGYNLNGHCYGRDVTKKTQKCS